MFFHAATGVFIPLPVDEDSRQKLFEQVLKEKIQISGELVSIPFENRFYICIGIFRENVKISSHSFLE